MKEKKVNITWYFNPKNIKINKKKQKIKIKKLYKIK